MKIIIRKKKSGKTATADQSPMKRNGIILTTRSTSIKSASPSEWIRHSFPILLTVLEREIISLSTGYMSRRKQV